MLVSLLALVSWISVVTVVPAHGAGTKPVIVQNNDPLVHFHGRWDPAPETWWGSTGFKLHVQGLSSLTLKLGNHTTSPWVQLGVSINYGSFNTVNVSTGTNEIPLSLPSGETNDNEASSTSIVRINVPGWQDNRLELEEIVLNAGAKLLPYTPSKINFQFIGDSLSAGQYLPQIVDQAWPFLIGENFKAEHLINAQPGIALSDILAYGNVHGMSYEYFVTEDTQYYYTDYHNFTTPWNFARDQPPATHVVIHIGANDSGNNVTADAFTQTYLEFLSRLRTIYHTQPFLIFTPWGWPQSDGTVSYYYQGRYEEIVNTRHALGDHDTFLVNTTGWVTYEDVFPDNMHPTIAGHVKIAGLFQQWLENWGLHPESEWATPV
ncbi:hypothetical protein OBBRIDRAFT_794699 [Obba rivulosa]|uniref:SGNH hydrolase-type esterase domain-containing protein n=1 Tax=Obba rivulosa TaxID=1052685 RepID=A0A8E2DKN3_9APHY|nr:hypothetical protein OBBRIDRAFT_794699 [Obba rivulosa]